MSLLNKVFTCLFVVGISIACSTLYALPTSSVVFLESAKDRFNFCVKNKCEHTVISLEYSLLDRLYIISTPSTDYSGEDGNHYFNSFDTVDEVVDLCYSSNIYCIRVTRSYFSGFQVSYFVSNLHETNPVPPKDKPGEGPPSI